MASTMNFVSTSNVDFVTLPATSQNTGKDGTGTLGTNIFLAFTAGSSGSFVRSIRISPLGTNVATVIRVFVNNGSTNGTASNNALLMEMTAPATTVSETAQLTPVIFPLNMMLDANYRLLLTYGTSVAAGFSAVTIAGDF